MSIFAVTVESINGIMNHPNADRLDIVQIKGWQVVTQRGKYKVGDRVVYIPIDSVLPPPIETTLFPPDAKVKLTKSRVRTIKLRGAISQGMIVDLETMGVARSIPAGAILKNNAGITKYEPPEKDVPPAMRGAQASRKQLNPAFRKYTDIDNAKNYPTLFVEGEPIFVTEKLHGTSARYARLPTHVNTFWKWIKKLFGRLPTHEFCYGSRKVQLQGKMLVKTYYEKNLYALIAKKYDFESKLQPGEAVYGEIIGHGVQKGYDYGHKQGEYSFAAYDVMIDGRWLNGKEFFAWCAERRVPTVPLIPCAHYNREVVDKLRAGPSVFCPAQAVREGIVVKPAIEDMTYAGRKVLKFINDEYSLKDQSEFH